LLLRAPLQALSDRNIVVVDDRSASQPHGYVTGHGGCGCAEHAGRVQETRMHGTRYAKWIFTGAGIYGLAVLLPLYFMEQRIGEQQPPAITHPEFYYGFIGVAVAWQLVFLLIGRDPLRYRPVMLAAVAEKAAFGVAVIALYLGGCAAGSFVAGGVVDLVLGVLFAFTFVRTSTATT
jgi:hypothetical protein